MGIERFSHFSVLILVVLGNVHGQIFDPEVPKEGEELVLKCNVKTAAPTETLTDRSTTHLEVLKMNSNNDFDSLVLYGRSGHDNTEINDIAPEITSSPDRITVTTDGLNMGDKVEKGDPINVIAGNAATMEVIIRFNNVICDDQGIYKCMATLLTNAGKPEDKEFIANLTITEFSETIQSVIQPNKVTYTKDDNVTFSCRSDGPDNIAFQWRYRACPTEFLPDPAFVDWHPESDILREDMGTVQSNGCTKRRLKSTLRNVQLDSDVGNNVCAIQCRAGTSGQFGGNFVEHQQWNMTIAFDGSEGGTGAITSSGGDDVPVGAIVGPIVGVLVLIAVVAVLLYFFWYRKRSREDDYHDDVDKPDSGDMNMHTAPPVFYTKPDKSGKEKDNTVIGVHNDALDTSYDSKDSASRGPPRYANTPDFVDGPPRYEKETNRGRSNRGYDENDRNGYARHGYGRDDDNRRDRDRYDGRRDRDRYDDRDHDRPYRKRDEEVPRARKYSTEDGTDNQGVSFDYAGDPNLGTAI